MPRNFDLPYTARSVSEFYRRWHITLGTWFRDYVYIPLGGSRNGNARTVLSLTVCGFSPASGTGRAGILSSGV